MEGYREGVGNSGAACGYHTPCPLPLGDASTQLGVSHLPTPPCGCLVFLWRPWRELGYQGSLHMLERCSGFWAMDSQFRFGNISPGPLPAPNSAQKPPHAGRGHCSTFWEHFRSPPNGRLNNCFLFLPAF